MAQSPDAIPSVSARPSVDEPPQQRLERPGPVPRHRQRPSPISVATVFGELPFREFGPPRPAGLRCASEVISPKLGSLI
jgi:hypothetical protein